MTDTDSYLLKCTLESVEEGVSSEEIQAKCECQLGLANCEADTEKLNQPKKGD